MTLSDLIKMTRVYCRDNNNYMFTEDNIKMFINQGIDRIKQYRLFLTMPHLQYLEDEVTLLPDQYQYLLALFASSRCYDTDERFYEGIQKRNEFESLFAEMLAEIESGNLAISDSEGEQLDDVPNYIEYIKDRYFKPHHHHHHRHKHHHKVEVEPEEDVDEEEEVIP